jgi:hypothetical protein
MEIIIIQNIAKTMLAALVERSSNISHHKDITRTKLKRKVSGKTIQEPCKYYNFRIMPSLVRIHILTVSPSLFLSVTSPLTKTRPEKERKGRPTLLHGWEERFPLLSSLPSKEKPVF